jgi:hypothetical protein
MALGFRSKHLYTAIPTYEGIVFSIREPDTDCLDLEFQWKNFRYTSLLIIQ